MNKEQNIIEPQQPAFLQGAVMRSASEIDARIEEVTKELEYWSKERWKTKDRGYIDHICNVTSELQGERNALKWVREPS